MNVVQVSLVLAIAFLWLRLLISWRLRNWRAVALGSVGTIAILAAGLLPNPVRGLIQAGVWLTVGWIFLFRPDLVAVMGPEESDYLEECVKLLRRMDRKQHVRNERDPEASVRGFEAKVRSFEALAAPPPWSEVHSAMATELNRRLTIMKLRVRPPSDEMMHLDDRWRMVEQEFRDVLKVRAGVWTGWPHLWWRPGSS